MFLLTARFFKRTVGVSQKLKRREITRAWYILTKLSSEPRKIA